MTEIMFLPAAAALVFLLCWLLLPYRRDKFAWFHAKFYRRGPFVTFSLALACSIWPVVFTVQRSYARAALVFGLGVGSCLLVSLVFRPDYRQWSVARVLALIFVSYSWPLLLAGRLLAFVTGRPRCLA